MRKVLYRPWFIRKDFKKVFYHNDKKLFGATYKQPRRASNNLFHENIYCTVNHEEHNWIYVDLVLTTIYAFYQTIFAF